jgi:hypothetical protein
VSKQRDYKVEYQRRIERAQRAGYSRAVARGHARGSVYGLREAKQSGKLPGVSKYRETGRQIDESLIDREKEVLIAQGLSIRDINKIDFHDEQSFINKLLDLGYTTKEAYTLRFSP